MGTPPDAGSRIGPGRLVLVVGPSGAGKDTLIAQARAALAASPGVVFPRRVITRPPSAAEDHDTLSAEAFARAVRAGAFALHWEAHGHRYGIPRRIDDQVADGRTVVCNVSRAIVGAARLRYANPVAVLVTAPQDVLAARLAGRGRRSDGSAAERLRRASVSDAELCPDMIIRNVGAIEAAAACLVRVIRGERP